VSLRDTIVRNTFWYGVVTAAGLVAGLLMSVVLARGLGPARLGDYSYLLWLLRTMTALAMLGYALATVRYTADAFGQSRPGLASAFLRMFVRRQVVTTIIVVVALIPVVLLVAPERFRAPLLVMLIGLFPMTVEGIYTHAAHGAQRYDLTTHVSALKMTLHLLAAVVVVMLGGDLLALIAASMVGTVVACVLQRRQALRLYPAGAEPVPPEVRQDVRAFLVPLSVVAVLDSLVWDRSEIFFLGMYAPPEHIAFYSLAFGLATKAMLAPQVVVGALLPAMADLHGRGDGAGFREVYREAIRAVALIGAPLVVVASALAPGVIRILYGEPYLTVALLLVPMLLVSLVGVMRQVAWAALRAAGDRRWALGATSVAAAVNIGAAIVLIPRWGMWGAVAANAAAQLIASALAFVGVAVLQRGAVPVQDLARITVAATAGLVATWVTARQGTSLVELAAAGVAGGLAFVAVAAVLGVLRSREWALIARPARRLPRWLRLGGIGLVVAVVLAALYAPLARQLVHVWLTVPYYSYGVLVPMFSAWAAWDARDRLARTRPAWDSRWLLLVVGGVLVLAAGTAAGSLTVAALSIPVVLGGLALFVLGPQAFRSVAFAVGFLVFLAPLPADALPALSLPLQHIAAVGATGLLPLAGVPATRESLLIALPGVTLHVTEACNGLRFLLAMLVLGTAFAWTTQRRVLPRILVVALAVGLAIAANVLRVAGTGVLAHYWGPGAAEGTAHIVYGKVVYLGALVPFVIGVARLRRPAMAASGRAR
jgi:exosortase